MEVLEVPYLKVNVLLVFCSLLIFSAPLLIREHFEEAIEPDFATSAVHSATVCKLFSFPQAGNIKTELDRERLKKPKNDTETVGRWDATRGAVSLSLDDLDQGSCKDVRFASKADVLTNLP